MKRPAARRRLSAKTPEAAPALAAASGPQAASSDEGSQPVASSLADIMGIPSAARSFELCCTPAARSVFRQPFVDAHEMVAGPTKQHYPSCLMLAGPLCSESANTLVSRHIV
jgi:hypothetical protein